MVGPRRNLYEFCINSVSAYAKRIGADHIILTKPLMKIVPDFERGNRSKESISKLGYLPIFEKSVGFTYLKDYEKVVIIDADIFIRDDAPDIFECYDDNVAFAGVFENDMQSLEWHKSKLKTYAKMQYKNEHRRFFNMGVMCLNRKIIPYMNPMLSDSTREPIFNELEDLTIDNVRKFLLQDRFLDFVNGKGNYKWSTDQTLLNEWIRWDLVPYGSLSPMFNCLYGTTDAVSQNRAHFLHFFLSDKLPSRGEDIAMLQEIINRGDSIHEGILA